MQTNEPDKCTQISYKGRILGELYGGGNPHYTLVLEPEAFLPLLQLQLNPEESLQLGNKTITYGHFTKSILPHVAHVRQKPQPEEPTDLPFGLPLSDRYSSFLDLQPPALLGPPSPAITQANREAAEYASAMLRAVGEDRIREIREEGMRQLSPPKKPI